MNPYKTQFDEDEIYLISGRSANYLCWLVEQLNSSLPLFDRGQMLAANKDDEGAVKRGMPAFLKNREIQKTLGEVIIPELQQYATIFSKADLYPEEPSDEKIQRLARPTHERDVAGSTEGQEEGAG